MNYSPKQNASALLLSFFMMSILIVLVTGVSFVMIRDVSTVRSVVAGSQARYAAEGMGEVGLLTVKNNLPGYEPSFEDYSFSSEALASLNIHAREETVPCTIGGEEWRRLERNESIQLPLFAQVGEEANEEGMEKILQFYVEFYVADEDGNVNFNPSTDVLRWKIIGLQDGDTEAISEFIPLFGDRRFQDNPTLFGSAVNDASLTQYTAAKYRQMGFPAVFHPAYPIEDFLAGHSTNYLVLTNVVQRDYENTIYFRLHAQDVPAVCEYIRLDSRADVAFGGVRQEIQTLVREGENLPVFDFVLYHTADDN